MTDRDLSEIKALIAAATPGPWGCCHGGGGEYHVAREMGDGICHPLLPDFMSPEDAEQRGNDASFMAASREYLPHCVEEIERLREKIKQLRKKLAKKKKGGGDE